jgi:NADH:ubiquinone oxidoreductase subunit 5 (subunit L)/multisubunit Na+/H+ antiporter MnhA subunit
LNGFVSELLIYLGAFGAVTRATAGGSLPAGGMMTLLALSLIGGLAAACFAKVYGIMFLGQPRSDGARFAREAPGFMRHPMTVLAGLCIVLGLGAPLGAVIVAPAAGQLLGPSTVVTVMADIRPLLVFLGMGGGSIVVLILLLAGLRRRLLAGRTMVDGPTWDCGYVAPTPRMQYTASSFAWPIMDMFRWTLRPRLQVRMDKGDFPKQARLASHTDDLFRTHLFAPLFRSIANFSGRLHGLQQGRNQLYVLYIAVTVLLLLLLKVR